ncbi:MAG: lamin tail domain-containing protein, partial [Clostridia bacterium]|nr:lamin tail domain-containing protein [Clostridia bacterium]
MQEKNRRAARPNAAQSRVNGTSNNRKKSGRSNAGTYILYIFVGMMALALIGWFLQSRVFSSPTTEQEQPISEIKSNSSPVLITEVMSDNSSVIQDSYGNYADWIEVTNVSSGDVNLQGWKIARDTNTTKYFEFP